MFFIQSPETLQVQEGTVSILAQIYCQSQEKLFYRVALDTCNHFQCNMHKELCYTHLLICILRWPVVRSSIGGRPTVFRLSVNGLPMIDRCKPEVFPYFICECVSSPHLKESNCLNRPTNGQNVDRPIINFNVS